MWRKQDAWAKVQTGKIYMNHQCWCNSQVTSRNKFISLPVTKHVCHIHWSIWIYVRNSSSEYGHSFLSTCWLLPVLTNLNSKHLVHIGHINKLDTNSKFGYFLEFQHYKIQHFLCKRISKRGWIICDRWVYVIIIYVSMIDLGGTEITYIRKNKTFGSVILSE